MALIRGSRVVLTQPVHDLLPEGTVGTIITHYSEVLSPTLYDVKLEGLPDHVVAFGGNRWAIYEYELKEVSDDL